MKTPLLPALLGVAGRDAVAAPLDAVKVPATVWEAPFMVNVLGDAREDVEEGYSGGVAIAARLLWLPFEGGEAALELRLEEFDEDDGMAAVICRAAEVEGGVPLGLLLLLFLEGEDEGEE